MLEIPHVSIADLLTTALSVTSDVVIDDPDENLEISIQLVPKHKRLIGP